MSNLESEALIAALKRFIFGRELIDYLCSDKDDNFIGASRELNMLLKAQKFLRQANDCDKDTMSVEFYSSEFIPYWRTVGRIREFLIVLLEGNCWQNIVDF
jgi:hypothetical protein